jgi:MFS family permease
MERTTDRAERGTPAFAWYTELNNEGRYAFKAAFFGWGLDAFDFLIVTFALSAIASAFALSQGAAGFILTVTLVASAVGGIGAGMLADRIGRARTLMITVAVYSVFTFLSGLAQSYEMLLVFRTLQGLGFGGEWATGAALIAEYSKPEQRGRLLGWMQSAWAVGWALAAIAFAVVFSLAEPEFAWRILFFLGIIPALLILYIRARVPEPEIFAETRRAEEERRSEALESHATENPLKQLFRRDLIKTTLLGFLLATGAQGGIYVQVTWLPTFLQQTRELNVVNTTLYLIVVIGGSFVGYIVAAYIHDWLGRRLTFALFLGGSIVFLLLYTLIPPGNNTLLLVLSFPLGFFAYGSFSGFGSYLAELFPTRARGAGQGFTYNTGRALGAFFPTTVGFLAAAIGLSAAIAFGTVGYALALLALLFLPETRGKQFVAID